MTAGTTIMRMTLASISTAAAIPTASIFFGRIRVEPQYGRISAGPELLTGVSERARAPAPFGAELLLTRGMLRVWNDHGGRLHQRRVPIASSASRTTAATHDSPAVTRAQRFGSPERSGQR
jgi:hypothetical protein